MYCAEMVPVKGGQPPVDIQVTVTWLSFLTKASRLDVKSGQGICVAVGVASGCDVGVGVSVAGGGGDSVSSAGVSVGVGVTTVGVGVAVSVPVGVDVPRIAVLMSSASSLALKRGTKRSGSVSRSTSAHPRALRLPKTGGIRLEASANEPRPSFS